MFNYILNDFKEILWKKLKSVWIFISIKLDYVRPDDLINIT